MKGTCIQKVKTRRVGSALSRSKTGRGIGRKKVRLSSTSFTMPSNRTDEDSGLGGDSIDTTSPEAALEEFRSKPEVNIALSSYFLASPTASPTISFQSFENKSKHKSSSNDDESKPKRLRLDMTEEASDLPDQKSNWCQTAKQILSFKNVPDLKPTLSPNCILIPQTKFPSSVQSGSQPQASHPKPQQVVQPVVQKVTQKFQKRKPKTTTGLGSDYSDSAETGLPSKSSDGTISLQLLSQPEAQHRARYQTEGSRGAVKDRSGHGHPIVKLNGYKERSVLQVFVASDGESVSPHVFYQACKVSGKNSTPCQETKIDGTTFLKINLLPEKDMTVSCDCVGILKERNVDVEKRVKKSSVSGSHKKSHKCRLVFRATVTLKSGKEEVLQVVSQPISCTQPPGLPEICRKSLSKCSVKGGEELFIIGKNFSKDTEVLFQSLCSRKNEPQWSKKVLPDKEYLQGTHLICKIPQYRDTSIMESVEVQIVVVSNGKKSDSQCFTYEPIALKKEPRDSVQLKSLPKGVSPTAVEFNRMYTNSGELLVPIEYSSSNKSIPSSKLPADQVKERAVVHPMIFNVSGTNAPSIATKTYTKQDLNPGTSSTATQSAPKFNTSFVGSSTIFAPSVNSPAAPGSSSYLPVRKTISVPPNTISINNHPFVLFTEPKLNKDLAANDNAKKVEAKNSVTLENLCSMLKLANTLPVNLQSSFLELLSNEIINRIKEDSDDEKSRCQPNAPVSYVNNQSSMLADSRSSPTQIHNYEKDVGSFKVEPSVVSNGNTNCFANQPNTNSGQSQLILPYAIIAPQQASKISTMKQQEAQYVNVSIWQPTTKVSHQNFPQERRRQITTQENYPSNGRHFDEISGLQNMSNQNCVAFGNRVNHPVGSRQINSKAISTESKQTNFNASIHEDLKLQPTYIEKFEDVSVNFSPQERQDLKVMQSFDSLFSSTTTTFDSQRIRVPEVQANAAPTEHTIAQKALVEPNQHHVKVVTGHHLQQEVIQSSQQLHFQLAEESQKQQTIMLQNSNGTMQGQENCFSNHMQNDLLNETSSVSLANYQPLCLESNGSEVHMGSINNSFNPSSVMQIESCDPLLSQASGASSLNMPQAHNNIGSQNLNPISSSVSSEVATAISQLSENDLINYINTNCFDNV